LLLPLALIRNSRLALPWGWHHCRSISVMTSPKAGARLANAGWHWSRSPSPCCCSGTPGLASVIRIVHYAGTAKNSPDESM